MNAACVKCGTSVTVDDAAIPPEGLVTQCAVCGHSFTIAAPAGTGGPHIDSGLPLVPPPPIMGQGVSGGPSADGFDDVIDLPAPISAEETIDLPAPLNHTPPSAAPPPPGGPDVIQPPPLESLAVADGGLNMDLPAPKTQNSKQGGGLDFSDFDLATGSDGPSETKSPAFADLPMPKGIADLPVPANLADLPRPAGSVPPPAPGVADLPQPAGLSDLPTPLQPIRRGGDQPSAEGITDLPGTRAGAYRMGGQGRPVAGDAVDLPRPVEGGQRVPPPIHDLPAGTIDLPGGTIDLPGPAGHGVAGGSQPLDLGSANAFADGADSLHWSSTGTAEQAQAADMGQPAAPIVVPPVEAVPDNAPDKKPSKNRLILLIAAGVVSLGAIAGVALLLLSGDGSSDASQQNREKSLASANEALRQDTIDGYRKAAADFATAAGGDPEAIEPSALRAQALIALYVRFGRSDQARLNEAKTVINKFAAAEQPPTELLKARALEQFANDPKAGMQQLKAVTDRAPNDAQAAIYFGWACLQMRQFANATTAFNRALSQESKLPAALFGLAQVEDATGNKEAAIKLATNAIDLNSAHGGAILLAARLQLEAQDLQAAETTLKRTETVTLTTLQRAEVQAMLGILSEKQNNINEARKHYENALKLDPQNRVAQLNAGKLALHASQLKQAHEHFKQLLGADPNNEEAALLLAETSLAMGNNLDARNALQEMLKHAPKSPRVRYAMARVEKADRAYEAATKLCLEAIELDSKYLAPYLLLSQLHLESNEPTLAFGVLQQASSQAPGARVRNAIGEVNLAIGKYEEARLKFEEALEIDPSLNAALFNLALAFRHLGKYDDALAQFNKLRERDNAYPGLAAAQGALFVQMSKYDAAAQSYEQAIAVDDPPATLRLEAGRAFILAKQYERALNEANEVLSGHDMRHRADAMALRAEAHMGLDSLGDALAEIKEAIERDARVEFYVTMAKIQERLNRPLDALETYGEAFKREPKRVDLLFERARMLVRVGTVKDGLREIEQVIRLKPDLAEAYLFKGIALADLGKESQAEAAYRTAIQRDPNLGEAHFRLGQRDRDARRFPSALTHFAAAAKNATPQDLWRAEALYLLGKTAADLNRPKEAIDAFQEFLKIAAANDAGRADAKAALAKLGAKASAEVRSQD